MCFQVYLKPSHRYIERELESSAKTKASTPKLILRRHSKSLSILGGESMSTKQKDFIFGIILTHLFMTKGEAFETRALMIPFLAIHTKGGESKSPKQRTAPPPISKPSCFQEYYQLVSYCVQKGEKVVFQK
jgi:hypothetical protein